LEAHTEKLNAGFGEETPLRKKGRRRPRKADSTINVLLLTNIRLMESLAPEAKTATLKDLHIPDSDTKTTQAPGMETDNVIAVAGKIGPCVSYTGRHSGIGKWNGSGNILFDKAQYK
jgi:adenosylcobinamide amidohydrolase